MQNVSNPEINSEMEISAQTPETEKVALSISIDKSNSVLLTQFCEDERRSKSNAVNYILADWFNKRMNNDSKTQEA